jgi:hypothetical protein
MSCFGSAAINKNGVIAAISPAFPSVRKLAIRGFAPPLGNQTAHHPYAGRLSNMSAFKRFAPSFELNQFAWLHQAKNLSGRFLSRRYPAARDLCGNGRMHKHVAKTGGVYE